MEKVTVHSSATVANIVCGFDILGFALNCPCDELTLEISDEPGVHIINNDDFDLPTEAEKNVSGASLIALLEESKDVKGFTLTSKKTIMPGSGIGSSAASAAGAVVAASAPLVVIERSFTVRVFDMVLVPSRTYKPETVNATVCNRVPPLYTVKFLATPAVVASVTV